MDLWKIQNLKFFSSNIDFQFSMIPFRRLQFSTFLNSGDIRNYLTRDVRAKLNERMTEENLGMAHIEHLERF